MLERERCATGRHQPVRLTRDHGHRAGCRSGDARFSVRSSLPVEDAPLCRVIGAVIVPELAQDVRRVKEHRGGEHLVFQRTEGKRRCELCQPNRQDGGVQRGVGSGICDRSLRTIEPDIVFDAANCNHARRKIDCKRPCPCQRERIVGAGASGSEEYPAAGECLSRGGGDRKRLCLSDQRIPGRLDGDGGREHPETEDTHIGKSIRIQHCHIVHTERKFIGRNGVNLRRPDELHIRGEYSTNVHGRAGEKVTPAERDRDGSAHGCRIGRHGIQSGWGVRSDGECVRFEERLPVRVCDSDTVRAIAERGGNVELHECRAVDSCTRTRQCDRVHLEDRPVDEVCPFDVREFRYVHSRRRNLRDRGGSCPRGTDTDIVNQPAPEPVELTVARVEPEPDQDDLINVAREIEKFADPLPLLTKSA